MWDTALELISRVKGSGLGDFYKTLKDMDAPLSSEVSTVLKMFNPVDGSFELISPEMGRNIEGINPTTTTTFEFGYKGILKSRLLVNADFYYSRIENFIGPMLAKDLG